MEVDRGHGWTVHSAACSTDSKVRCATLPPRRNENWDFFGHSHARDVIVDFGGHRTENVDDHLNEMRQLLVQYPDMLVVRHDPNVAEDDSTATVAYITGWGPGQVKFVTVAKWRDDKVVEEYLFTRELNEDETTAAESGEPPSR